MAQFLHNRRKCILVIEFGKAGLKIASFSRSSSKLELLAYSLEKLEPGPQSKVQIVNSIRGFLNKNSLSAKEAILSIADQDSVAIKYCLLPALKSNEILNAAIWQLKDEVHFDLNDAYSDWRVVKEFVDEEGARHQGTIFVFARKEFVEDHLACLSGAHLRASAIVTGALNYSEILKGMAEDKAVSSEIVLDLGCSDSSLNLYIDKKLYFIRYLPFSVDNLTRSLIGTLTSERGKVEVTSSLAEEIRDKVGIPDDGSVFIHDNLRASQILSLVRPVLESLVREIKHSMTYFTSQLEVAQPQIIHISGFGAKLKNLDTYLAKELGVPVSKLPFPDIMNTGRVRSDLTKDRGQLVSCAGAVLLARREAGLLAGDVRKHWIKNILLKRLAPFAVAVGAVVLSLMLISLFTFPMYSYRLKAAKSFFDDKKQLFSFFEKARLGLELKYEISLQRANADALLNFISESIPNDLRLDGLELDQYHGQLILQGQARKDTQLDIFINKLKASDLFVNIEPASLSGQEFKIKCKLKY